MANGRVLTGFSLPVVAKYTANEGTVTYSSGQALARGVDVTLDLESSDSSAFWADNIEAETIGGQFTGGTVTLTVDGLKDAARKLIQGLTATKEIGGVNFTVYDNTQDIPYMGLGFICRYMENGVTSWVPVILPKIAFDVDGMEAATQEEDIEFQTQELTATIMRDDTATHQWRLIGEGQETEAAALATIHAMFNISA